MVVLAILKKEQGAPASLSTNKLPDAILMEIAIEKHACFLIKIRIQIIFFREQVKGIETPPQEPLETLMNALGLQRMQGHGQSRRGNQRRF
jgi:hypothetical protein